MGYRFYIPFTQQCGGFSFLLKLQFKLEKSIWIQKHERKVRKYKCIPTGKNIVCYSFADWVCVDSNFLKVRYMLQGLFHHFTKDFLGLLLLQVERNTSKAPFISCIAAALHNLRGDSYDLRSKQKLIMVCYVLYFQIAKICF